jgi:hypothetical protein
MLRTNSLHRTELCDSLVPPSLLEQTFLLTGFSVVTNLFKVSEALGRRDYRTLETASDRNAKLSRLREEVCEQVAGEMRKSGTGESTSQKLALIASSALAFERMGEQTVKLAAACVQVIRHPVPSRVTEIRKLMEHGVQMADSTCAALVYEQALWAKGALEEGRAASTLSERIERDLDFVRANKQDSAARAVLLQSLVSKTNQIIEETKEVATKIIGFLKEAEVHA